MLNRCLTDPFLGGGGGRVEMVMCVRTGNWGPQVPLSGPIVVYQSPVGTAAPHPGPLCDITKRRKWDQASEIKRCLVQSGKCLAVHDTQQAAEGTVLVHIPMTGHVHHCPVNQKAQPKYHI
ncbi:unnamed protein product [Lota lota]